MDPFKKKWIKVVLDFKCEWCKREFDLSQLYLHRINKNQEKQTKDNIIVLCRDCCGNIRNGEKIAPQQFSNQIKKRSQWAEQQIEKTLQE
jgi:hypothetical protein